ncbi:hypothetical protein [Lusitaniella coriacea]|uniref:hypothetical protein n=1 Tax=Lusitaniella coriacea TaxID=1983105 RepID=UPI003CFA17AA
MNRDRAIQIEKNLNLLYEQLAAVEEEAALTQNPRGRMQCKQQIREQIKPEIQKYELEYFQVLQQNVSEFAAEDVQVVLEVVAEEVERVQNQPDSYPQQIVEILQRIEATLNEPGETASGKLKGTLSLIPPLVKLSYERELDTENFGRKYFPTFTRLLKSAKK